jgi:transcriptional regulator with XRE-family HTH domain
VFLRARYTPMMRSQDARKTLSATDARNLRRLLLLNVFEPEEIGARIKDARERAGLRQEDLADLIGMSTRQVQNYEAGMSKQYSKLKGIAEATGATVEWLLHGDEDGASPRGAGELAARLGSLEERQGHVEELLRELLRRLPGGQDEPEARAG